MAEKHFLRIDVGTGSARAAAFDEFGNLLGSAKAAIALWQEAGQIVEQSSNDIWRAVCACVQGAVRQPGISKQTG